MRLTKIVLRRFSRPLSFAAGFVLFPLVSILFLSVFSKSVDIPEYQKKIESASLIAPEEILDLNFLLDYKITGQTFLPGRFPVFYLTDSKSNVLNSDILRSRGYKIKILSDAKMVVSNGQNRIELFKG